MQFFKEDSEQAWSWIRNEKKTIVLFENTAM
jgi:hypothetical protein